MGKLSTHVLDTMHGVPAQGVRIDLYRIREADRTLLKQAATDADGRCEFLLQGASLQQGVYELVFHAGDYFAGKGTPVPEPRFVDQVVLRFGVANAAENYHVPLLVTPWAWSTYRGS
ncbi:hydroxyisourate hydrolase [Paralcaligenes sp. KSB-10]|jgi:5-hydroxyisourate hydrolase|uniref:hydroxyisourate hydrolase n=1 Tax=Paralcaligenes sp. KSB-10 TaxID=2901142 RepID=UPI001E294E9F|nr:hydroxyisourate hydrolase [Paralcaligenes sp. KSB-10]UHL63436.1 hydroxyisourate hydrolase [Paralcaligenes sp. KSB-10]